MGTQKIPHDFEAEESVLGAMLLTNEAIITGIDSVKVEDFYNPTNARIFGAILNCFSKGIKVDAVTVASEMNDNQIIPMLIQFSLNTPSSSNITNYAAIVRKHSISRSLMGTFEESTKLIRLGEDPFEMAERVAKIASGIQNFHTKEPESMTLQELEDNAELIAPVVIPGMMHRDYRTIVVAEEGAGKSLLLRTIAMTASQGYHPFSHQEILPIRALIVDLENPTEAITQTASPLMRMMQEKNTGRFDQERLRFWRKPGGIDIRRLSDKAELQREIMFHKPELVCIGPIYKMYRRNSSESYEDSADEAMAVLDELRTRFEFALIMEHHAAKGKSGEKRDLSPMGSQRWMAWPEIGISLYKDTEVEGTLNVKRYRGDRLQGVSWPDRIYRNRQWLVEGVWD